MRYTLKKHERIRKKKEFEEVFSNGKWVKSKHVAICYCFGSGRKAGFIVSKKISKKAVVRNKVKRRLREIFRLNKYELPENTNLILVAKPGIESIEFGELEDEVKQLFKKISYQGD